MFNRRKDVDEEPVRVRLNYGWVADSADGTSSGGFDDAEDADQIMDLARRMEKFQLKLNRPKS
ncbi:MAG TPA: hypothetical protein VK009_17770 [Chloroflexota bacterium]|nr:hypothetical protein [Chloroflexota bacterium]